MFNIKNGYSLTVLVITIAVIIIITTTAVVSIKNVTKDREISKFMSDLEEVKQFVVEYFAKNDSLPVIYENDEMKSAERELIELLSSGDLLSQLNENDAGDYYYIDITKLGKIHLDDENRGYIVNEGTLNIYVKNPCEYDGTKYYTLTPYLLGEEHDENEVVPFQINILGNPVSWVERADILVSIPDVKIGEADGWNFKWLKGSRTATEFKEYEGAGNKVNYFDYGDAITFRENGIYTIYVENPEKVAVVRKVVITKVDDIAPVINLVSGEIYLDDGQTGISKIRYKITENSNFRIDQETKEEYPQYYMRSAEVYPDTQEDILDKYLWADEELKGETVEEYLEKYETFYSEYTKYNSILMDVEATSGERDNARAAILTLNDMYPQFAYKGRRYSDVERNIVLYVEDMVGNATVYSAVNRNELVEMQYVSSDALTLIDSQVIIDNNKFYTNTQEVSLYLQSLYAKHVFTTEERGAAPNWQQFLDSNVDFTLSAGDGEKIVYAFFRDNQGKVQGVYDKIFLDATEPTNDAPTVTGTVNSIYIVVNQTDSDIVDGVETQSGIANVSYGVKEGENGALLWYNKPSLIPRLVSGITYTFVTKAVDKAGNEQISEPVTLRFGGDTLGDAVQIGDYVSYTPDTEVGSNVAWRVWKIEENGDVVITPTEPVGNLLLGEDGNLAKCVSDFRTAITQIENECDKYKSETLGITENDIKSMAISDLENTKVSELYNYKSSYVNDDSIRYNQIKEYSSGTFYMSYNSQNNKNEVLESEAVASENNLVRLLQDYYYCDGDNIGWKKLNNNKFGEQTYGSIIGNESGWLSSTCTYLVKSGAGFYVRRADNNNIWAYSLCNSFGDTYVMSEGVRPLITLDSSLKVDTTNANKNGSSSTNAWVVSK